MVIYIRGANNAVIICVLCDYDRSIYCLARGSGFLIRTSEHATCQALLQNTTLLWFLAA